MGPKERWKKDIIGATGVLQREVGHFKELETHYSLAFIQKHWVKGFLYESQNQFHPQTVEASTGTTRLGN